MGKPRKDGQRFNMIMDRNLYNRLSFYADEKGQTMTLAIERLLKQSLDDAGVPEDVPNKEKSSEERHLERGAALLVTLSQMPSTPNLTADGICFLRARHFLSTPNLKADEMCVLPSIHTKFKIAVPPPLLSFFQRYAMMKHIFQKVSPQSGLSAGAANGGSFL